MHGENTSTGRGEFVMTQAYVDKKLSIAMTYIMVFHLTAKKFLDLTDHTIIRHDICHMHHMQRMCKIISSRVKFHILKVLFEKFV